MLNTSKDAFAEFIEQLPVAIACFDEKRRYIALNQACAEINGVSHEDTIGKYLDEVVPDLVDVLTPVFDQVYIHGNHIKDTLIEGKTPASDKVRFWRASYQSLALESGATGLLVTAEEITQQIFATKSAETNRKLLTDVLNSLFTFVGLLDAKGVLLDANKAPLEAAGIDLKDVQGKYFWDCFWWTYSSASIEKIKQAVMDVQAGKSVRFDIDVRVTTGFLTIDFMMEGLRNSAGQLTHIIPSAIDISERKQAEAQLLLSQSRFETVINRTVDGLIACDQSGVIRLVNKPFEALVGHTVTALEENFFDYIDDLQVKERLKHLIDYVQVNGIKQAIKYTHKNPHQHICFLKPNLNPIEIAFSPLLDGKEVLYLATVSDVSALYEANKALEVALQEKTVLLNEVHHRVKNNLQVMSSLLNLQANADGTNQDTKDALLDSQRRLKSMALIHQLLYERKDFSYANLQQFTSKLLGLLQDSMVNSSRVTLLQDYAPAPIILSLNQLVPYGFLLTELITNAYKHAFNGANDEANDKITQRKQSSPTIKVSIQLKETTNKEPNMICLVVTDNGCGLDAEPSANTSSLGSDLIRIFSRQLHANIHTQSNNGVTHIIEFQQNTE